MIGDTVAATTPHLASGAGIGIESGIVLAEELGLPRRSADRAGPLPRAALGALPPGDPQLRAPLPHRDRRRRQAGARPHHARVHRRARATDLTTTTLASGGRDMIRSGFEARGRIALIVAHCAGMLDVVALPVWVGTLIGRYAFRSAAGRADRHACSSAASCTRQPGARAALQPPVGPHWVASLSVRGLRAGVLGWPRCSPEFAISSRCMHAAVRPWPTGLR